MSEIITSRLINTMDEYERLLLWLDEYCPITSGKLWSELSQEEDMKIVLTFISRGESFHFSVRPETSEEAILFKMTWV